MNLREILAIKHT